MFAPALNDEAKAFFKDRVMGKFKYVDSQLAGRDYLMGKQFTVADGYLFTMLTWGDRMKFDLSAMPNLMRLQGPRRGAAEGAGSAEEGRADEGCLSSATRMRKGRIDDPAFRIVSSRRYGSGTTMELLTPPPSSAGSGRRRSRPSRPSLPAVSAG